MAAFASERHLLGKVGAVVGRAAAQRIFQLLQEPILIDSQDGEVMEDVPTKVLAQILHHILANQPARGEDELAIPDEHLELLQDFLEKTRPPIKRKPQTPPATPTEGRSSQGEHVIKFMRRQADFDALRVAGGVVFTVAGVIEESPELRDESLLLGKSQGRSTKLAADSVGVKIKPRSHASGGNNGKQNPQSKKQVVLKLCHVA